MVHIYKEMMEAESEYLRLCHKYGEQPVYKKYLSEMFGEHAESLRKREREELENAARQNKEGPIRGEKEPPGNKV